MSYEALNGRIGRAKSALAEVGCLGATLRDLVSSAVSTIRRARRDRSDVHAQLRAYGFSPEGKRLGDAVGEALRSLSSE